MPTVLRKTPDAMLDWLLQTTDLQLISMQAMLDHNLLQTCSQLFTEQQMA